jgi:predicted nucleic acid-binding protein
MGLILDSSVLIKAERQGQNARQMLTAISLTAGNTDIAISVVTLIELAHGAARVDTAQHFCRSLNNERAHTRMSGGGPECRHPDPRPMERRRCI